MSSWQAEMWEAGREALKTRQAQPLPLLRV